MSGYDYQEVPLDAYDMKMDSGMNTKRLNQLWWQNMIQIAVLLAILGCVGWVTKLGYDNKDDIVKAIGSIVYITDQGKELLEGMQAFLEGRVLSAVCASSKIREYIGPLCGSSRKRGENIGLAEEELVQAIEEALIRYEKKLGAR